MPESKEKNQEAKERMLEMFRLIFTEHNAPLNEPLIEQLAAITTIYIVNGINEGHQSGEICGAKQVADNAVTVIRELCPDINTDDEAIAAMNAITNRKRTLN